MRRRLLVALVWLSALFLVGIARIVWRLLGFLVIDIRRLLLLGGFALAMGMTDFSALDMAPQIVMPAHPITLACVAIGVLLILRQGWTCPWSRGLRVRFRNLLRRGSAPQRRTPSNHRTPLVRPAR